MIAFFALSFSLLFLTMMEASPSVGRALCGVRARSDGRH